MIPSLVVFVVVCRTLNKAHLIMSGLPRAGPLLRLYWVTLGNQTSALECGKQRILKFRIS